MMLMPRFLITGLLAAAAAAPALAALGVMQLPCRATGCA